MKLAFAFLAAAIVSTAQCASGQHDAAQAPDPGQAQPAPQDMAAAVAGMKPSYITPNGSRVYILDPQSPVVQLGPMGALIEASASCPVGMQARHGMDGGMVKVRSGASDNPRPDMRPGQIIHLSLNNRVSPKRIVSATVKVSGLSARTRVTRSDSLTPEPDLWRTVQVDFAPDTDQNVTAYLKLPGFTTVTSIRLVSVKYDDGSEWTLAPANHCSVQPDPFMPVALR